MGKRARNAAGFGRKRRLAGWVLVSLGVAIACAWAASRWWSFGYYGPWGSIGFAQGSARWSREKHSIDQLWGWRMYGAMRRWVWTTAEMMELYERYDIDWKVISRVGVHSSGVPKTHQEWRAALWPAPVALWLAASPLLVFDVIARARERRGRCGTCGYSFAGLDANALCPECGHAKDTAR